MISCKCIATAPSQFKTEGIELSGVMLDHLRETSPGNCLQGDLYTIAYAAGAIIMAKLAVEGHLTTEADLALIFDVIRSAVAEGTAQWQQQYPEKQLHAVS